MSRPKKRRRPPSRKGLKQPSPVGAETIGPATEVVRESNRPPISEKMLDMDTNDGYHTLGPIYLNRHDTPTGYRVGLAKSTDPDTAITELLYSGADRAGATEAFKATEHLLGWLGFEEVEYGGGWWREPDGTLVDSEGSTWEIQVECPGGQGSSRRG